MHVFFQYIINGLQNGAIYAALGLAVVLIYRSAGLINFAVGEMAMFATFITWGLLHAGLSIGLAVVVSMAIAFASGAATERLLIRPIPHANSLAAVIVTLGLALVLNALAQSIWGTQAKTLPSLFPSSQYTIGGVQISAQTIGMLIVLAIVAGLMYLLFTRTKLGLGIRAATSNVESSRLAGVRVGRVLMLGWGISGAIGALAGAMIVPVISAFDANFMQALLVLGFAAATLGGFDSLVGAVVGGLIIGVAESLFEGYVDEQLKLAFVLAIILVVLLVRPSGLFGSREVVRV
jgi:branched-chain amino acid transport system permease protein